MTGERLRATHTMVLGAVIVTGLAGTAVAIRHRDADPQFLQDLRNPPPLTAAAVERVVRTAPDPQVGSGGGESASCTRGSDTALGNPWSCIVTYKSGRRVRIRVRVLRDGTYTGRYEGGGGASGCCIDLPGTR